MATEILVDRFSWTLDELIEFRLLAEGYQPGRFRQDHRYSDSRVFGGKEEVSVQVSYVLKRD